MNRTVTIPRALNGVAGVYNETTNTETVFGVLRASAPFFVQLGNDGKTSITTAGSVESSDKKPFRRLSLSNTTTSTIDVTFYIGTAPFKQSDTSLTAPKGNIIIPYEGIIAGSGGFASFSGTRISVVGGVNTALRRRRIRITNTAQTRILDLQTQSEPGTNFGWVLGTDDTKIPFELETSEDIYVTNNNVGTVTIRVAEVFDLI